MQLLLLFRLVLEALLGQSYLVEFGLVLTGEADGLVLGSLGNLGAWPVGELVLNYQILAVLLDCLQLLLLFVWLTYTDVS